MRQVDVDEVYKVLTDYYHHRTKIQHEALKEAIEKVPTVDAVSFEDYRSMEQTVNKLTKAIADAESVKHGHWITDMSGCWCSVCNEYSDYSTDYCPNCGAKMKGESDE